MTSWLGEVVPILRDAHWPGWGDVFARQPPTIAPSTWAPHLGYGLSQQGAVRMLSAADVGAAGIDAVHAAAMQNLARRPATWQVKQLSKGLLGMGKKPVVLECVDELAAERLLLTPFVEEAMKTLRAAIDGTADFFAPVRGLLWATVLTTRTGRGVLVDTPFGKPVQAEAQQLYAAPAGREPLCGGASFVGTPAIVRNEQCVAFNATGVARRAYRPLRHTIVPGLLPTGQRTRYSVGRTLTEGVNGLTLQVGVEGPLRFSAFWQEAYQDLGLEPAAAEALAFANLAPAEPEAFPAAPDGRPAGAGFRGPSSAVRIADPTSMGRLHVMLRSKRLHVVLPTDFLLVARPESGGGSLQEFFFKAGRHRQPPLPPGAARGAIVTEGIPSYLGVHVVEDGRLVESLDATA